MEGTRELGKRVHFVLQVRDERDKVVAEQSLGVKYRSGIPGEIRARHGTTAETAVHEFLAAELGRKLERHLPLLLKKVR
jgi:hypothetical protein